MGMCDQGPAMLVNEEIYTKLTPDKVHTIVAGLPEPARAARPNRPPRPTGDAPVECAL